MFLNASFSLSLCIQLQILSSFLVVGWIITRWFGIIFELNKFTFPVIAIQIYMFITFVDAKWTNFTYCQNLILSKSCVFLIIRRTCYVLCDWTELRIEEKKMSPNLIINSKHKEFAHQDVFYAQITFVHATRRVFPCVNGRGRKFYF